MKAALCVDRAHLVPSLNYRSPNPAVPGFEKDFEVLVTARPWPSATGRSRRAGVSAFGMGGTNAHVILEQSPEGQSSEEQPRPRAVGLSFAGISGVLPWVLSARSEPALREQAARLRDLVAADASLSVADVGHSLVSTRSLFEHRAVVLGAERAELIAGLASLAVGESGPGVVMGAVPSGGTARAGFVFAGQGVQRAGMGRELHAAFPVFAAAFDQACALLEAELELPVAEVVLGEGEDRRADRTVFAQAGLFAVEVGLVALLAAAGIRPDAVAGHSVGEITAAYVAGVLSLEDACALVGARGRLMQALPSGGAMIAVQATEAEITAALDGVAGVSVAAVNGPSSVVVSGDAEAAERVAAGFKDQGRRTRRLRVSHAFHSHRMDPVLDELGEVAARLEHAAPRLSWAAALTGQVVSGPGPEYWARQARGAVRYADAVVAMAAQGVSVFVEVGPDETLSGMGAGALDDSDGAVFVPVLRPGRPAAEAVPAGLAEAFVHGAPVDWAAVLVGGRRVELPTYAFQRQRYWLSVSDDTHITNAVSRAQSAGPGTHRTAVADTRATELDSELSVLKLVCHQTAAVLGQKNSDVTGAELATRPTATFKDLGFDSSMAVRLRNRLTAAAGVRLPATVAFTYPTPRALGCHIFSLLEPEAPDVPDTAEETSPERRSDDELYELVDRGYV